MVRRPVEETTTFMGNQDISHGTIGQKTKCNDHN